MKISTNKKGELISTAVIAVASLTLIAGVLAMVITKVGLI